MDRDLLEPTERGLYCPPGDFYIDPWSPVDLAVVTHAHSDHARWGMKGYLASREGEAVLRTRLGSEAQVQTLDWGEPLLRNGVRISLHPAGHILGSAQVRVEYQGKVAVVTGDYKTEPDPTCTPYEPLRCHLFVTESTFGLPIYHWPAQAQVFAEIDSWWRANQEAGRASLLMGYALGKAQRALAGLNPETGPIFVHGSVASLNEGYAAAGVRLPEARNPMEMPKGFDFSKSLIVAPPSVQGTPWLRRFGDFSDAFLSGWMAVRGTKRRRSVDRGFVLSDHVDWPSLMAAIGESRAETVWVTHGYTAAVVRYLREQGIDAHVLATRWEGEQDDGGMEG